jgi:serine/arginine repetitive matrix protein 1
MITGFLEKDAAPFSKSLWKLLLSAQNSPQGVPKELLEAKKAELERERVSLSIPLACV